MTASETSFAPASTIETASCVPTTTRSNSDSLRSFDVGLKTNWSPIFPTRTAPRTCWKGIVLIASAAAAPLIARTSGSFSPSAERTRPTIWVSWLKPSGKSGRNGRSIIRQVRISFSVGRPSRLKKPPGIRPAAYWYSLYSTVRGRKSMSFGSFA